MEPENEADQGLADMAAMVPNPRAFSTDPHSRDNPKRHKSSPPPSHSLTITEDTLITSLSSFVQKWTFRDPLQPRNRPLNWTDFPFPFVVPKIFTFLQCHFHYVSPNGEISNSVRAVSLHEGSFWISFSKSPRRDQCTEVAVHPILHGISSGVIQALYGYSRNDLLRASFFLFRNVKLSPAFLEASPIHVFVKKSLRSLDLSLVGNLLVTDLGADFESRKFAKLKHLSLRTKEWVAIAQHITTENFSSLNLCHYSDDDDVMPDPGCIWNLRNLVSLTLSVDPSFQSSVNFCVELFSDRDFCHRLQKLKIVGRMRGQELVRFNEDQFIHLSNLKKLHLGLCILTGSLGDIDRTLTHLILQCVDIGRNTDWSDVFQNPLSSLRVLRLGVIGKEGGQSANVRQFFLVNEFPSLRVLNVMLFDIDDVSLTASFSQRLERLVMQEVSMWRIDNGTPIPWFPDDSFRNRLSHLSYLELHDTENCMIEGGWKLPSLREIDCEGVTLTLLDIQFRLIDQEFFPERVEKLRVRNDHQLTLTMKRDINDDSIASCVFCESFFVAIDLNEHDWFKHLRRLDLKNPPFDTFSKLRDETILIGMGELRMFMLEYDLSDGEHALPQEMNNLLNLSREPNFSVMKQPLVGWIRDETKRSWDSLVDGLDGCDGSQCSSHLSFAFDLRYGEAELEAELRQHRPPADALVVHCEIKICRREEGAVLSSLKFWCEDDHQQMLAGFLRKIEDVIHYRMGGSRIPTFHLLYQLVLDWDKEKDRVGVIHYTRMVGSVDSNFRTD